MFKNFKDKEARVDFLNWDAIKQVASWVGAFLSFLGLIMGLFGITFKLKILFWLATGFLTVYFIVYLIYWIYINEISKLNLKYGESTIEIKPGDIFSDKFEKEDVIRVFAFNEYFDTEVDNKIISEKSLNGKFIKEEVKDVKAIHKLDKSIEADDHLKEKEIDVNDSRSNGKKIKYELGTIYRYNQNVFLTALSHFDKDNKAYLSVQDYMRFLINFWDEINNVYAGKTIVIPLLGSGITRLDHNIYSSNQILEMILWTFYLRRIKFKKPARLVILIDKETNKCINYYMIRRMFNGLQK